MISKVVPNSPGMNSIIIITMMSRGPVPSCLCLVPLRVCDGVRAGLTSDASIPILIIASPTFCVAHQEVGGS